MVLPFIFRSPHVPAVPLAEAPAFEPPAAIFGFFFLPLVPPFPPASIRWRHVVLFPSLCFFERPFLRGFIPAPGQHFPESPALLFADFAFRLFSWPSETSLFNESFGAPRWVLPLILRRRVLRFRASV